MKNLGETLAQSHAVTVTVQDKRSPNLCLSLDGLTETSHDRAEPAGAQPTLCLSKTHLNPSVYSWSLQTPGAGEDPRSFSPSPERGNQSLRLSPYEIAAKTQ